MLSNFKKDLIVYGGLTNSTESTKDWLYTLNLESLIWSRVNIMNTGEQLSSFSYEKIDDNEILLFGGEDFLK